MEWLVVVVVTAVAFFLWQGFRTRCPSCGAMALHPHDKAAEREQHETFESMKSTGLLDALDQARSSLGSASSKPGYVNAPFSCRACQHPFTRNTSTIWLTIRNKIGEERAQSEHRKLQNEFK